MARDRYLEHVEFVHRAANPGRRVQRTLREAFEDAVDGLRERGVPFVLHGAFALAAYGYERATRDVDLLVPVGPEVYGALYGLMGQLGAVPARPGPRSAGAALARGARHLTFNLAGWELDFFLDPEFDAVLGRARRRAFAGRVVDVIAPEDLIERKLERGTPQDLADVDRLQSVE